MPECVPLDQFAAFAVKPVVVTFVASFVTSQPVDTGMTMGLRS